MAWIQRPPTSAEPERIQAIATRCGTYPFFIKILLERGYSESNVENFFINPRNLIPDSPLVNSREAAELILKHLHNGSNIAVFADYDVDGLTSGYVMTEGLREIRNSIGSSAHIQVKYPERNEGYGLNSNWCSQMMGAANLVITVDNGISKKDEVTQLQQVGCDVVITDHHPMESSASIPDTIIIDPMYNDEERGDLAGVGVAWHVLNAVNTLLSDSSKIDTDYFLDAVAVGTIADMMKMTPENIGLIILGLKLLNDPIFGNHFLTYYRHYKHTENVVSVKDIGWDLGPMLNAAGRLGDVLLGAAGFYEEDEAILRDILYKLSDKNSERKAITKRIAKEMQSFDIGDYAFAAYDGSKEAKGVHGIMANELAKRYPDFPCFVYERSGEVISGSVRCQADIPLLDMLKKERAANRLISVAGHNNACVISMLEADLEKFLLSFTEMYNELDYEPHEDDIVYDMIVKLSHVNTEVLNIINSIPFDRSTVPVFRINDLLVSSMRPTKNNPNNGFYKLSDDTASREVFVMGMNEKYESMGSPSRIDVLATIEQDFRSDAPKATIGIIDFVARGQ